MNPKYPNITVDLSDVDGDALSVIGAVARVLRNNKVSAAEITEFRTEAMSGDYNNVLQTCFKWVNIDFNSPDEQDDDDYYEDDEDDEDDY